MACSLATLIRKRVLRSWRGCGGRSNWQLARRIWRRWARLRARERSRRAGLGERGCCWPTGKTHRFLRWGGPWGCIIRLFSAALSGRWLVVRWRRSTICRGPAGSRGSPPRPRHGLRISPAARPRNSAYPHELWTTRLLARHAREHGPAEGHACLAQLAQGTLCNILNAREIKPHKVRYYLERRDPEFKQKMAEVLCVYREVRLIKETAAATKQQLSDAVAIVSYDEKPGIQAIATTAPDLPPEPGKHATFARDHEYKRHGTVSLLAGIDLLTGQVHALVKDRHRSREFIEFRQLLDAAYPAHTAIKLILDNHSAHISEETKAWLARQPAGRFRIHLHAQARLLAQPRRGLLLQARSLGPAPHPRHIQTGAQGPHHGCYGRIQSRSGRSHLVL